MQAATNQKDDTTISRMGWIVSVTVFIALVVDGCDTQMLSLALSLIASDFNLSSVLAGSLGSVTFAGMMAGGILGGWLADRVGRIKVIGWGILLFSFGTAALGITQNYWQFAIIRFFSAFGLTVVYSIGTMLAAEYIPTKRRTTVLGTLQAAWSVGYIAAAILSAGMLPIYGWRPMFFLAIIPSFLALIVLRYIKEPESWQLARAGLKAKPDRKNEWATIWADNGIRRIFLLWIVTNFFLTFGYFGANVWLPSYVVKDLGISLKSMGWFVAGSYTAMVFGKVIAGYFADKFGRKIVYAVSCIATAIAMPLIVKFATPENCPWLLLIFGFCYGAPWAINATYMSESFPTSIRGTAVTTAYSLGRIGSIVSPMFVGYIASNYSIGAGIGILGIGFFLCGLMPLLFIPEKLYDPKSDTK